MSGWVLPADTQLEAIAGRLPSGRTDQRILDAARKRQERLRIWLQQQELGGVLLSRRDNFGWLTGGGDSHVLNDTELGSGHLLITPERHYLLAYSMDAERIASEQISGQGYEVISTRWHEADPRELALPKVQGRLAVDAPLGGAEERAEEIARLHGPLADFELDRLRWLGRRTALLLEAAAEWVQPGMTEEEIGWRFTSEFALQQVAVEVVIVGSDERLQRIWHATPSGKQVRQYLSMHAAARRWGLHAPVNRLVSFGQPPERICQAHRAALTVQANVLAALRPRLPYAEILRIEQAAYAEAGYPDEWQKHFQGGPTGYFIGDGTRCWTELGVEMDTAFDWFLTVDGIQVEELTMLTPGGVELASSGSRWPMADIHTEAGVMRLPDVWVRER